MKSLPFHIPEAWKRHPFWAGPPRIGYYRVPPSRATDALSQIDCRHTRHCKHYKEVCLCKRSTQRAFWEIWVGVCAWLGERWPPPRFKTLHRLCCLNFVHCGTVTDNSLRDTERKTCSSSSQCQFLMVQFSEIAYQMSCSRWNSLICPFWLQSLFSSYMKQTCSWNILTKWIKSAIFSPRIIVMTCTSKEQSIFYTLTYF